MIFQSVISLFSTNEDSELRYSWSEFVKYLIGKDDEAEVGGGLSSSPCSLDDCSDMTSFSRVMASFIASNGSTILSDKEEPTPQVKTYRERVSVISDTVN